MERTNSGTMGLRLLAGAAAALFSMSAGAALADNGGISVEDPPPAPACSGGAEASGSQPDFDVIRRDADPGVDYQNDGNKPELTYKLDGTLQAVDIEVRVVKDDGSGKVVKAYCPENVPPETAMKVEWDNTNKAGNKAPKGKYKFQIRKRDGSKPDFDAPPNHYFQWRGHFFPVRGSHYYGDGWGAGRGHKGTDVFAACGTTMKAARSGTVQWKAYQGGGAGHYIVIDGDNTSRDYVYMHMKGAAVVNQGQHVDTKQLIGYVGQSGNASGCHVHFELWKGDWYNGGYAYDSKPSLKKWDSWS